MDLPIFYVDELIKKALHEDINYIDVTTDYLIEENSMSNAVFLAKDDGVLSGIEIAIKILKLLDPDCTYTLHIQDKEKVKKGDLILSLNGKTRALLKGERTALNIVCHMSGIASMTNKCVELVKGTNASIVDTRKTLPTLRPLQKYAVICGGGKNHRYNLSDGAMLKDNHIDAYKSITNAVNELRKKAGHMIKIEVESRNLEELNEALNCDVDVIMLDNMDNDTMKKACIIAKEKNPKILLEASGNITLDNIASVAKTGVDIISLGALTHSVTCFDISMKITNNK